MSDNSVIRVLRSIPVLMRSKIKYLFAWSWTLALSLLIAGKGFPPIMPSILIFLSMIFVVTSVYTYNDINDREMDRENVVKKNRPIASGEISKADAEKVVYLFGIIGLAIAWFVNIYSFGFILLYFTNFFLYSHPRIRFKNMFLGKDFSIFIGWPLTCLAANYAISSTFSVIAFSSSILTSMLVLTQGPIGNESSDIVEDIKYGVKSLSTMLNWKQKVQLMLLGIIIQIILVPIIQIQFGSNFLLPVISILMLLTLLKFSYPLINKYDLKAFNIAYKIAMLQVFTSPFTFVLISSGLPLFQ